jgi:hypothetical protein
VGGYKYKNKNKNKNRTFTVLSADDENTDAVPMPLNATAVTFLEWPVNLATTFPESIWVKITFLSVLPERMTGLPSASPPLLPLLLLGKLEETATQVMPVLLSALCGVCDACTARDFMLSTVGATAEGAADLRALRSAERVAQVASNSAATEASSCAVAAAAAGAAASTAIAESWGWPLLAPAAVAAPVAADGSTTPPCICMWLSMCRASSRSCIRRAITRQAASCW